MVTLPKRSVRKATLYLPPKMAERVKAFEDSLDGDIVHGRAGVALRKLIALGLAAVERAR